MTDRRRLREWLAREGARGVHTFDIRRSGIGNPSERVRELRDEGLVIIAEREARGDRVGVRYRLEGGVESPSSSTHILRAPVLSAGMAAGALSAASAQPEGTREHGAQGDPATGVLAVETLSGGPPTLFEVEPVRHRPRPHYEQDRAA